MFSLPVKEYQIVENFLGPALKDEVMKIMPVQKQTRAGQRTRFKVGQHKCRLLKPCLVCNIMWWFKISPNCKLMGVLRDRKRLMHSSMQAFVVVGDYNGHVGLGVKCAKEVNGFQAARIGS